MRPSRCRLLPSPPSSSAVFPPRPTSPVGADPRQWSRTASLLRRLQPSSTSRARTSRPDSPRRPRRALRQPTPPRSPHPLYRRPIPVTTGMDRAIKTARTRGDPSQEAPTSLRSSLPSRRGKRQELLRRERGRLKEARDQVRVVFRSFRLFGRRNSFLLAHTPLLLLFHPQIVLAPRPLRNPTPPPPPPLNPPKSAKPLTAKPSSVVATPSRPASTSSASSSRPSTLRPSTRTPESLLPEHPCLVCPLEAPSSRTTTPTVG